MAGRRWRLVAWAAAAFFPLAGCSDSGDDGTRPDGGGQAEVSFADDIQPIFTASCAVGGCHGGGSTSGGLTLAAGQSHAALVNVPAQQRPDLKRIRPVEPDSSYLYLKITGAEGVSIMPPPPSGSLPSDQITLIRTWIENGALDD